MKTKFAIDAHIDNIDGKCHLSTFDDKKDDNVFLTDDAGIDFFAKKYNLPRELVEDLYGAFCYAATDIADNLRADLVDIWRRMDEMK